MRLKMSEATFGIKFYQQASLLLIVDLRVG